MAGSKVPKAAISWRVTAPLCEDKLLTKVLRDAARRG
jgi:hypothetical protein